MVFDLDGTLIRSAGHLPAWIDACAEFGLEPRAAANALETYRGRPLIPILEAELGLSPAIARRCMKRFQELAGDEDCEPMPGADATLRRVHARGHRLFLSTASRPALAARHLEALGWSTLFSVVLGTEARCPKGPTHYRRFASSLGVGVEEFAADAITIGDGRADMSFARDAGVAMRIGFNPSRDADYQLALREAGALAVIARLGAMTGWL